VREVRDGLVAAAVRRLSGCGCGMHLAEREHGASAADDRRACAGRVVRVHESERTLAGEHEPDCGLVQCELPGGTLAVQGREGLVAGGVVSEQRRELELCGDRELPAAELRGEVHCLGLDGREQRAGLRGVRGGLRAEERGLRDADAVRLEPRGDHGVSSGRVVQVPRSRLAPAGD